MVVAKRLAGLVFVGLCLPSLVSFAEDKWLLKFNLAEALAQRQVALGDDVRAELELVNSLRLGLILRLQNGEVNVDRKFDAAQSALSQLTASDGPHFMASYLGLLEVYETYQNVEQFRGSNPEEQRQLLRKIQAEIAFVVQRVGKQPETLKPDFILQQSEKTTRNKEGTGFQQQPDRYRQDIRKKLAPYVSSEVPLLRLGALYGLRHILPPRANMQEFAHTAQIAVARTRSRIPVLPAEQVCLEQLLNDMEVLARTTSMDGPRETALGELRLRVAFATSKKAKELGVVSVEYVDSWVTALSDNRLDEPVRLAAATALSELAQKSMIKDPAVLSRLKNVLADPDYNFGPGKSVAAQTLLFAWDVIEALPDSDSYERTLTEYLSTSFLGSELYLRTLKETAASRHRLIVALDKLTFCPWTLLKPAARIH